MEPYTPDPASIAGKPLDIAERTHLVVVGGGAAGLAAAIEARARGLAVLLVDENPIPAETMGDDLPLMFGQRATGAARNRTAMLEAVLANTPAVVEAFEAGVDVRLGTVAWGLYTRGPSSGWLPGPVVGVADGERSSLIACERVIVAAGCRDMGLAFPGWDRPGVMGAVAAARLSGLYGALDARTAIVLGTTTETLATALELHRTGVAIAAVIEQAAAPVGTAPLIAALEQAGVAFHCRSVLARAEGAAADVERVTVVGIDGEGRHDSSRTVEIACDTVILGIGRVPLIELLQSAGCRTAFIPGRGGFVPVLDEQQGCSIPGLYAIGDAAGAWPAKSLDPEIAREEARRAARHAAASIGRVAEASPPPSREPEAGPIGDLEAYRLGWVRASVVEAEGCPFVCRCEEVTAEEILEVRAPRYLGAPEAPRRNARGLRALLGEGAPHPDQVKRLTRAGMGLCQGRRCREQVQVLLALGAGVGLSEVPLASYRAPVRPLPLRLAGQSDEARAMAEHWDAWFGMAQQYTPPWRISGPYTARGRHVDREVSSE